MERKGVKRLVYIAAILVLAVLSIVVWYNQVGNSERKEFIANGGQEAQFEFLSSIEDPQQLTVRFEGTLECDGFLTLKSSGTNVKLRRTFPVTKSGYAKMKLECAWNTPEIIVEFRTRECELNGLKIIVELSEK